MTINKYQLSKRIAERIKCTNVLASLFINTFSDIILEELSDGNSVMLGAIGKLSILEIIGNFQPLHSSEKPACNTVTKQARADGRVVKAID